MGRDVKVPSEADENHLQEERFDETPNAEKESTAIDKAKKILADGKDRAIEFWDGNKHWIAPVAHTAAVAIAVIVKQAMDNDELKRENERLNGEVDYLRQENQELNDENDYVTGRLVESYERHAKKDAYMDAVASDDMRRGGSLGAQVLRSKQDYLWEQGGL